MYKYAMNIISTLIIVVCGYIENIGALILVRYEKSSPVSVSDLVSCGVSASAYHDCAAQVNNSTCYPLEIDWCVSKDMSDGGVYIVKKAITERLEKTLVSQYERTLPIYLSQGSELEFKFKLHSGWTVFAIDLMANSKNFPLHMKGRSSGVLSISAMVNGYWRNRKVYNGIFPFTAGTNYTLKKVCATNGFKIYLDGALILTNLYGLPADASRIISSYSRGAPFDIYQVTYKAGP